MTMIGLLYMNGQGVAKDAKKAFDYFLRAAELDYGLAQYFVGVCYENGNGVNQNIFGAKRWYKKAANNGDKEAEKALERLGVN